MLDGFFGLRHHAVIGSNHQDDDVGGLCTTGSHGCKRLVTWRVQKGHHATICLNVISANVLGNTTGFTRGHFGTANVVKQ